MAKTKQTPEERFSDKVNRASKDYDDANVDFSYDNGEIYIEITCDELNVCGVDPDEAEDEICRIESLLSQLKRATKYASKKRDELQEELDELELEN